MIEESEWVAATIEAFFNLGIKTLYAGYRKARRLIPLRGERPELIRHLFLDSGDFLFHPSSNWSPADGQVNPPPAQEGYPHDISALWSFEPFLPDRTQLKDSLLFPGKLTPTTRLVCSGSPKSNRFTRQYLPSFAVTADIPKPQYPNAISPERLTYLFGEDLVAPKIQVVSMMHKGTLQGKTRKVIWRWHRGSLIPWSPAEYEKDGMLYKGFLLVSRLPRTKAGADILAFAGGHGAGTQAVSLLLAKLPFGELKALADVIGDKPYFQFVLEVSGLRHEASGTIPTKVEISSALPPVALENLTTRDLGSAAKQEKK
ncbi:MAG TPA: hypothetical protein VIB39_16780 [Candidatus Angelobacter sp.]|jgi:hypothetical protein